MSGWQFCMQNQLNTFHIPDLVCSELCAAGGSLSLPLHLQWYKRAGIQLMKDLCPGLCLDIKSTHLFHIINAQEFQQHSQCCAAPLMKCPWPLAWESFQLVGGWYRCLQLLYLGIYREKGDYTKSISTNCLRTSG